MAGRRSSGFGVGLFHLAYSDMVGEGLGGECSMAEDDGVVALERDHGGFDAVIGWAGVDDQVDPVTEFLDDVCRRGRADTPEPVGARRSDGHAGCRDQGSGDRVRRTPDADGRATAGDRIRHDLGLGQHHREGSGPERSRKPGGDRGKPAFDECVGHGDTVDVDDQRIRCRSALGLEHTGDCVGIKCVAAEAVDRLGRDRDEPPLCERGARLDDERIIDRRRVDRDEAGGLGHQGVESRKGRRRALRAPCGSRTAGPGSASRRASCGASTR